MVVIVGEGRMNLRQRKVWVLKVYFCWTPAVGHMVEHDFDDFHIGIINPSHASIVKMNVCCFYGWNGLSPPNYMCTVIAFLEFEHLVLILPDSLQIIYGGLRLQLAHDYTIYHIMPQRVSE